jgi:hypothetical protein
LPYEKKFYAIFALFLAALIFIASKTSASNIACHKNHYGTKVS